MDAHPAGPTGRDGTLFVLSAPSGTGKSTIARTLVGRVSGLVFAVSHTTRKPRPSERDGVDYHFVDEARFRKMIDGGEFLEWAEVHGRLYGTAAGPVRQAIGSGADVLLDIDVQGGASVLRSGLDAVGIFMLPPDYESLRSRLADRGTESPEQVDLRLSIASKEAREYAAYRYVVINRELDEAVETIDAIVRAERCATGRMTPEVKRILDAFPGSAQTE